ncbi:Uncharacterised protein [uncultured archaeon]|nr:Uncharacterised protein [uncultured archaeon]
MNRTINIKNSHFAITYETPEIIPNPNNPEISASTKNTTDQNNNEVSMDITSITRLNKCVVIFKQIIIK